MVRSGSGNPKTKRNHMDAPDSPKVQLADKLKSANNILVTVSRNPSVDQLSACIGLTLLLNKQGKHAAAVFSGAVPSTIEFLQPEDTLEKNTDSLRDFIIALDKSKADKLRYKVEDNVVRIFITPYKTSITQDDLEFSQGDFNVDVVVALGVAEQTDLDEAITAHGRILHDATVSTINVSTEGSLGTINWNDATASSLSELVTDLSQLLGQDLLDSQIATALLTGIVAETDRFSNEKTTPQTMSASAQLMAAGANQQLVASKLENPVEIPEKQDASEAAPAEKPHSDDGTLEIEHGSKAQEASESAAEAESAKAPQFELPEPVDDELHLPQEEPEDNKPEPEPEIELPPSMRESGPKLVTEAPTLGGMLTANSRPEGLDPSVDPLSQPTHVEPLLNHSNVDNSDNVVDLDALLGRKPSDQVPAGPNGALPGRKVIAPLEPEEPQAPAPVESPPVESPVVPPVPDLPLQFDPSSVPAPSVPEPAVAFTPPEPAVVAPAPETLEPPKPEPIITGLTPPPPAWVPPTPESEEPQTLTEIEAAVKSPHVTHIDDARSAVEQALSQAPSAPAPEPIQALNAQPLGGELHPSEDQPPAGYVPAPTVTPPTPTNVLPPTQPPTTQSPQVIDPNAPPPVPPPIPFQFGPTNS